MTGDALPLDPLDPPASRPGHVPLWRSGFGDLGTLLRSALRLLVRHWPVVIVVSFAGMAARGILTWAAVHVAAHNSVAGLLVFILIPLVTLIALALMLRVLQESLPSASGTRSAAHALNTIGSVLIPFLAIYGSYGYLQEDRSAYYYATWDADQTGPSRIPERLTLLLVVVIVVAVAARTLLDRWSWARDRAWLGIVRAYLEIVWIAVLVSVVEPLRAVAWSWLQDRRVVHGPIVRLDQLGQAGRQAHAVLDWVGGLLGSADGVIATLVAWLAVGAVLYGREVAIRPIRTRRDLVRAVSRRWVRLPGPVRQLLTSVRGSLDDRFGPLFDGLRLVVRIGLVPMLAFCLVFQVARATSTWLFLLERWLIGPRDLTAFWMPVSEPLSVFNDGITWVVLICLLGAATDHVLRVSAARLVAIPAQRTAETVPVTTG